MIDAGNTAWMIVATALVLLTLVYAPIAHAVWGGGMGVRRRRDARVDVR